MYSKEYVNGLLSELQDYEKTVRRLREENKKLQSMLDEDNNKLIKETERADNLSDHVQKLQSEIKRLKHN
jgi:polyhydroxyalkanoate synthesis regulator phasin